MYAATIAAITAKNAPNSLSGSSEYIDARDTYGNTRSIAATSTAHIMSLMKSFFCPMM